MCGIIGFVCPNEQKENLKNSLKDLEHRGPDDQGWIQKDQVSLGHTRLSIRDLSPAGHQPMVDEKERYFLTYNGEIYNTEEIKTELKAEQVEFTGTSDTEVLFKALMRWGELAIPKLVGMFAFAFYDARTKKMILARDPFGIKPLYYFFNDGLLTFASEISPIIKAHQAALEIDAQQVYDYLLFGSTDMGEDTFLKQVKRVLPGHYYVYDVGKSSLEKRAYFDIDINAVSKITFAEAVKSTRDLFFNSMIQHQYSDVPLSSALSGGIDSSAVVSCMQALDSKQDIQTFSYISEDKSISEEKWVDILTQKLNLKSHKIKTHDGELSENLDKLILVQGEPFASTSIFTQFRVFEEVHQQKIKVSLDGQGADEVLAGYPRYAGAYLATILKKGKVFKFLKLLKAFSNQPSIGWKKALKNMLSHFIPSKLIPLSKRLIGLNLHPSWLKLEEMKNQGARLRFPEPKLNQSPKSFLKKELYISLFKKGLPELLRYSDRNSMIHSVESRVPFLQHEFVRFILSLPDEYLISDEGQSKYVFREAMRGLVPNEILDRKDKIGFATPEEEWLLGQSEYVEKIFREADKVPFLNPHEILHEWQEFKSGKKKYNGKFWRVLNYIRWVDLFSVSH